MLARAAKSCLSIFGAYHSKTLWTVQKMQRFPDGDYSKHLFLSFQFFVEYSSIHYPINFFYSVQLSHYAFNYRECTLLFVHE